MAAIEEQIPAWMPRWLLSLDDQILATNVSVVSMIFLGCAVVAWLALARHRWGRQLVAIGGNEQAARLAGVPVVRAKTLAYVAAGALAAIAGVCQAAQEQQGDPEAGAGYELIAIAMVVIYMLLATQFRSYAQPFVVMLTVPFACVGVVAGLLVSDYPFTIMTFIAIVGLTGVIVNDSIVMLDFVNKRLAAGLPTAEAIRAACRLRFRPVILTTVTTVLGLLPLALGWGGTSKIWSPFASSFAWGLAFSTVVTLVIEPALYHIVQDAVSFLRRRREAPAPQREPAAVAGPPI